MTTEGYATGIVSIEEGNPPVAEYTPARKVKVEIGFAYDVNGTPDEPLAHAANLASATVAQLLGRAAAPVGEASAPATTRTRRTKAQIAADEAAARAAAGASQTGSDGGAQTSDETDFDPAAIGDEPVTTTQGDPASVEDDPAAVVEDEWASEPVEEPAEEITDADLNSAVQKKNAELSDPPRIRELIGSYNPDPKSVFQLRQIPQAKRQEFLNKLAALKKA